MERRSLQLDGPLDLRATLRPLHGRFRDDGWWLTARTGDGQASLRVRRTPSEVIGEAWGDGAGNLLDRLHRITGLEDDPSEFQPDDVLVADLHRTHPGWRFGRTDQVFDALLVSICGQKVTGQEAAAAMSGLYRRFGDPAPGPDESLRLPPDPTRMAESPYHEFHRLHLEKRRADVIRTVSARAAEIDALAGRAPEQAAA
ncbi:MAG TPA: DNA-3-methyladenine glycosylase 2 family protein, partial [Acidimicrobiia bacterium]